MIGNSSGDSASLVPLVPLTRPRTSGTLPQEGEGQRSALEPSPPWGRGWRGAPGEGKVHRENLPFHNSLFTIYYL